MCLIAGSAVGGLLLLYAGLFGFLGGQFQRGGFALGMGSLLAGGCWALCRHSDDLIDRTH